MLPLEALLALLALLIVALLVATARLRREREELRARRLFIARLSHELRTPLTEIRLYAETLELQRWDAERAAPLVGGIGREAARLARLVEDVLHHVRMDERHRPEPYRSTVRLGVLTEHVLEALQKEIAFRRAQVDLRLHGPDEAQGDEHSLRQALSNVMTNALKYGPAGQTITIDIGRRVDDMVELAVTDEGPGVAPADRERVWRAFTRLSRTHRLAGGTGLGLSIVRDIVQGHGGATRIEEGSTGGARVVMLLPPRMRTAELALPARTTELPAPHPAS